MPDSKRYVTFDAEQVCALAQTFFTILVCFESSVTNTCHCRLSELTSMLRMTSSPERTGNLETKIPNLFRRRDCLHKKMEPFLRGTDCLLKRTPSLLTMKPPLLRGRGL